MRHKKEVNIEILDIDGYPTEDFLDYIKNIKITNENDILQLFSLIQKAWHWGSDFCHRSKNIEKAWYFYTGGWSGNESILSHLRENIFLQAKCKVFKSNAITIYAWDEGKELLKNKIKELIEYFE